MQRTPFRLAPWVVDDDQRAARIGAPLDCPLCDRTERPDATQIWDERSMPAGLRRAHRVAGGVWGLLRVQEGTLRFRAATQPPLDVQLGPDQFQAIPPETDHDVEPQGAVRFLVRFLGPAPRDG